ALARRTVGNAPKYAEKGVERSAPGGEEPCRARGAGAAPRPARRAFEFGVTGNPATAPALTAGRDAESGPFESAPEATGGVGERWVSGGRGDACRPCEESKRSSPRGFPPDGRAMLRPWCQGPPCRG